MRAAPDVNAALPVRDCSEDEPLDAIIPFSSLILLGVVVAVEDRYGIRITREQLSRACRERHKSPTVGRYDRRSSHGLTRIFN